MSRPFPKFSRGAIALVALSFVSVLGLVLAGYFAISQQSMRLSNRSYGATVSEQLAELGLEEALRALNTNNFADWTSGTVPNQTTVDWTLTAATATTAATAATATATITPPATRYGNSGVTGTAKIRIDNYDAYNRPATWANGTVYGINDLIGDAGIWYRCVQNHTAVTTANQPPNLSFWVPAPIPWQWSSDITYNPFEMVNSGGTWYRYVYVNSTASSGNALSDPRFWRAIPSGLPLPTVWSNATTYYQGSVVSDVVSGVVKWFVYVNAASSSGFLTSNTTYWQPTVSGVPWASSSSYSVGHVVSNNGLWYFCSVAQSPTASFPSANWTVTMPFSTLWTTATGYARGSITFRNGFWYYSTVSHTSGASSQPPNAAFWVQFSSAGPSGDSWTPSTSYNPGDFVFVSPSWYYCNLANNDALFTAANWVTSSNPSTQPFIWPAWRTASINYRFNDVVFFSSGTTGTWYRCVGSHTSSSTVTPTGTNAGTNWENALTTSFVWSAASNYNVGDEIFRGGLWYRCSVAHKNQGPPNTAFWATTPLRSPAWDSGRQYAEDDMVTYSGTWYRCLSANNGINPSLNAASEVASGATWAAANTASSNWNSATRYTTASRVTFAGDWYRCIQANDNISPGNPAYWTKMGTADMWSSTSAYTIASRVTYGGVWYRCILNNTNIAPGNATYWIAMGAPVVYAEGTAALIGESIPLKTQLRATLAVASLVPNAVAGTTTLTISGAGTVDSYDAQRGTYNQSTPPFSGSSPNAGFLAVLAAGQASGTAATITNTRVQGYVAAPSASAAPHAPLTSFGGSAVVTGSAEGTTVDSTRVSRSPFIPLFGTPTEPSLPAPNLSSAMGSVSYPRGTQIQTVDLTLTAAAGHILNLGTPGATTPSRYYFQVQDGGGTPSGAGNLNIGDPSISPSPAISTLNILGPVILYVRGYLRIRSGGIIDIKSTGSLELHCDSVSFDTNGHGIRNRTLDPTKLTVIADSSFAGPTTQTNLDHGNSSINKDFYGVIYVPNTTHALGLEIRTGVTIYGAVSARKVTFSTEANVHYDTTLRSTAIPGVERAFMLTDWRELTNPAERVTLP